MQSVLIGAKHMAGIAKASGNPYDFAVLYVLRPISLKSNEKMRVSGAGLEQAEIRTSLEVVKSVGAMGAPFPCRVVLTIDNVMGEFGQLQSVCTAVALDRAVAPARAA
jgi:hypothetical protein